MCITAKALTQFSYTGGDAPDRENTVASPIPCLRNISRPADIGNLIIAFIVNALNRPSLLTFANIGNKVFKRLPSVAQFNPSVAVVFGVGVSRTASVFHAAPDVVNACSGTSVRGISLYEDVPMEAAARLGIAGPQGTIADYDFSSTVTKTATGYFAIGIPSFFGQYKQPCEPLTDGSIFFGRHNIFSFIRNVVFSGGRSRQPLATTLP